MQAVPWGAAAADAACCVPKHVLKVPSGWKALPDSALQTCRNTNGLSPARSKMLSLTDRKLNLPLRLPKVSAMPRLQMAQMSAQCYALQVAAASWRNT